MHRKISQFWDWFEKNNKAYLFINQIEDLKYRDELLDALLQRLHEYCSKLYFELGGHSTDEQELIITADGNIKYFDQVTRLIEAAPGIDNWKFIGFIQPKGSCYKIDYEGVKLNLNELWFLPLEHKIESSAIGIKVLIKNYEIIKDKEFFLPAIFKALDMILGEVSFALDIDYITAGQLPDHPVDEGLIKLSKMPEYINWHKNQFPRNNNNQQYYA